MSDLTPEQRVQKNTLAVMTHVKYRPLGGVLMMGKTTVEGDPAKCPTAYTDGFNVTYGAQFILGLTDEELRFLILHEVLHKALRHLTTWQWMWKEDPEKANRACDYVINLQLVDADAGEGFIKMPAKGCLDTQYRGMDSGEVFRLLPKDDGSGGGGFDEHGWEEANDQTPEQQEAIAKEVESALQQGTLLAGKMDSELSRAIGEALEPQVNWKEELREFVMAICAGRELSTWRRPKRRTIDSGIYLPASYSETVGRMVIGVDTSGSISGDVIGVFLGEVVSIAQTVCPELIDLLYWGTRVVAHEKYGQGEYESILSSTKPKGGGGTAPSCVTSHMRETNLHPECVIMLTDGIVGNDWGGVWPCPVLWCVVDNKRKSASVGKTLHIRSK